MQLYWGNYAFPVNAAAVTSTLRTFRSQSGRPLRVLMDLRVTATLFGTTQTELTTLENQARSALAQPYKDLVLKQDDGNNSGLRLINRSSVGGVVITDGPNFMDAEGPEYVKTRTLEFTGEAEFILAGVSISALVSFFETVSVLGNGGPVRRWRVPVGGDSVEPIRQIVTPRSMIRYTQSGEAVGLTRYPVPRPIFPTVYLQNENEAIMRRTPSPKGNAWVDWPISWNYIYDSPRPLTGEPQRPVM